jgi:hypothetical protein
MTTTNRNSLSMLCWSLFRHFQRFILLSWHLMPKPPLLMWLIPLAKYLLLTSASQWGLRKHSGNFSALLGRPDWGSRPNTAVKLKHKTEKPHTNLWIAAENQSIVRLKRCCTEKADWSRFKPTKSWGNSLSIVKVRSFKTSLSLKSAD